jgi:hypothetical protein
MARIRSIKPEFWEDEDVASLSPLARLLYIATWNMADDEGLLRWGAPYLKSNAFMYDDDIDIDQVAGLMAELETGRFVMPYQGGKTLMRCGWIVSFPKHQKPNRPQPSKLPFPSLQNPVVREVYAERDGWTCSICGEEIPQIGGGNPYDLHGHVDMSRLGLSLDHVVPQAKGGHHYPSNIRAAHRACNSGKKDSMPHSVNDSVNDSQTVCAGLTAVGEGRGVVGIAAPVDNSVPLSVVRGIIEGAKSGAGRDFRGV